MDVTSKPLKIFLLSVFFAVFILAIRIYFNAAFGDNKNTFIIFYPVVMLSALLGGWIAGVTTLAIFVAGSMWFLLHPKQEFFVYHETDSLGLLIFIVGGLLMSFICNAFLNTRKKYQYQSHILSNTSKKLQESRDQMQTILENVADGIIVRDRKGRPVYANPTAYKLLDIPVSTSKQYFILTKFDELFKIVDETGKKIPSRQLPGYKILHGEKYAERILCFHNKKTSSDRWFLTKAKGIFDETGNIRYVVIVLIDITASKKLEQQKDDFIGIASHELKTPVTSLRMYLAALQNRFRKESNMKAIDFLDRMDNQISRLTLLIGDLLDVTNIERGKLPLRLETFEINALISEIAGEVQITSTKHKIKLDFGKNAYITADRNRIGQVVTNLMTNAIKYSPDANEIIIKTKMSNNLVFVSVVDFGIGLPEKNYKKLFERFYRKSDNKASRIPGLGLGLYITSQIIKRHHGKIWAENNGKKGSIFAFSLPLAKNN